MIGQTKRKGVEEGVVEGVRDWKRERGEEGRGGCGRGREGGEGRV